MSDVPRIADVFGNPTRREYPPKGWRRKGLEDAGKEFVARAYLSTVRDRRLFTIEEAVVARLMKHPGSVLEVQLGGKLRVD